MKRVRSACISQTLVFSQKPELDLDRCSAIKTNRDEFNRYLQSLERAKTRYRTVDVEESDDGSVIVHIIKQYNDKTDVSEYF